MRIQIRGPANTDPHTLYCFELHQADPSSKAHQQSRAAGVFVDAPGVRHELLGTPVLLSDRKAEPRAGGPVFGAHTDELLEELGYSDAQAAELTRRAAWSRSRAASTSRGGSDS